MLKISIGPWLIFRTLRYVTPFLKGGTQIRKTLDMERLLESLGLGDTKRDEVQFSMMNRGREQQIYQEKLRSQREDAKIGH